MYPLRWLSSELNLNHFLIPFGFDLNRDGVINNLDVYSFFGPDTEILTIGKILKLLDQDQDGIYKFVDLKNFVVTFWSILDENHDMKLSMEDGLLLLKNKLGVSDDKISLVDGYVKYVKAYLMSLFLLFLLLLKSLLLPLLLQLVFLRLFQSYSYSNSYYLHC